MYGSASGDGDRDAWERAIVARALSPDVPVASLAALLGQHAGLGALRVAAAAWTAVSGRLVQSHGAAGADAATTTSRAVRPGPGLVHGIARGGTHVALVVAPPPGEAR